MEAFGGFEPQVGEIRALRTFRIGPDGGLYPLFDHTAWTDGANTAHCLAPRPAGAPEHEAPDPDCHCGFYAYGTEQAARDFPRAGHVLAVVASWGKVIAGSRGIRAQYARVEALWLSDSVPADLAEAVARRYPAVARFADREAMLHRHPPTGLDCYDPPSTARRARAVMLALGVAVLLLAGTVPVWAAPLSWLVPFVTLPMAWIAALLIVERRRVQREAARFPAYIEA